MNYKTGIFLAIAIVSGATYATPSQAGVAEFFNSIYSKILGTTADPDPSDKMVAPFADEAVKSKATSHASPADLPVNRAGLDQPHRRSEDLSQWIAMTASEVLTFDPANQAAHTNLLNSRMTPAAQAEFNGWLTQSGIMGALQANSQQLSGFAEETPFLLNEGAVAGTYRWLFEVPVMISFLPRGTTSYERQADTKSQRLILTLQVGRDPAATTEDAILIETWSARANTREH